MAYQEVLKHLQEIPFYNLEISEAILKTYGIKIFSYNVSVTRCTKKFNWYLVFFLNNKNQIIYKSQQI